MTKYNIGDVIQLGCFSCYKAVVFGTRIGIITDIMTNQEDNKYGYEVIIAGIEGNKYFVYEDDIKQKL
jgi:hypothetical protein